MMQLDTSDGLVALADGARLVTFNQRLSRYWFDHYQRWQLEQGVTHWQTPLILPWSAWLEGLHIDAVMAGLTDSWLPTDLAQRQLWRRVIGDSGDVLLNPGLAADGARDAWATGHAWRCFGAVDPGQPLPGSVRLSLDQFTFKRWSDRYSELAKTEGFADTATLPDRLASLLPSLHAQQMLPSRLLFAGFDMFTPQQVAFVDAFVQAGGEVAELKPINAVGVVKVHEYVDAAEELEAVVNSARQLVDADASRSIAVVIPDLHARRADVLAAFDRVFFPALNPDEITQTGRPYDLSLGLPLSELAVVRSALLAVQLHHGGLESAELSRLLHSPYLARYVKEHHVREVLDRKLREQGIDQLDAATLLSHLLAEHQSSRCLIDALQRAATVNEHPLASTGKWARRFGQLLNELDWPGKGLDSAEYQAVQAWYGCLDRLVQVDDGSQLDAHDALLELTALADDHVFQLDTPSVPVRIMGRLESRGLQADHVFVCGLDSDAWPVMGHPSPYLPVDAQQQAGHPATSHDVARHLAEVELAAWQTSAPTVVFSHATSKGDQQLLGAPLLLAMAAGMDNTGVNKRVPTGESLIEVVRNSMTFETVVDESGPPVAIGEAVRGGARLFENQALCPFKAFATHRLGIRALEEPQPGLNPRETGNLVHRSLEEFWKVVKTSTSLLALDDDALAAAVMTAITMALDEEQVHEPLRTLEEARLHRLLMQWIDTMERPREPFEVQEMEQEFDVEFLGIQVRFFVDRIDQLASGQRVIIDYKSGTSNSTKGWAAERIENPQLPVYTLLVDDIDAVAFGQVARHKCKYIGLAREEKLLPGVKAALGDVGDWQTCQVHWQQSLETLATEIREGHAAVDPTAKACRYCNLTRLCRVDADMLALRQAAEDGEEESA